MEQKACLRWAAVSTLGEWLGLLAVYRIDSTGIVP